MRWDMILFKQADVDVTRDKGEILLSGRKGFTLLELMVVIIILGVLAGLVLPRFMGRTEEAKRTKAKLQIENLEAALKLYKLDNGSYPTTEQGLEALVQKPTTGAIPKNWREGGYLEKGQVPLDPWESPYAYLSPGVKNKDFDLKSLGADGEEGGEGENVDIER
jgi:general secretion pathway protein G